MLLTLIPGYGGDSARPCGSMDAHSNEGWLITSDKGTTMWVIHQISFLNPKAESAKIKPTIHLTNNNGEGRSIQIDAHPNDLRRLTIAQLEDR